MTENQKNPIGRPTDYDTDFHPENLLLLAREGNTVIECCAEWNISNQTFYNWLKIYPEFFDAYQRAKPKMQAWLLKQGRNGLIEQGDKDGYSKLNDKMWGMLSRGVYKMPTEERAIIIEGFAEAKSVADKRNCVLDALAAGEITASEADKFLGVLERGLKIGEATELLARLEKLEEASGLQTGN